MPRITSPADISRLRDRLHPLDDAAAADARARRAATLRGDHVLNPGWGGPDEAELKDAAVLIPLILHPARTTVLLTQRSAHLSRHAGQIAFPGGRIDPDDAGPVEAALREAEEEIGLAPALVEPVGLTDTYISRTGYRIHPVVGVVRPDFDLRPNPGEVDEVFEVPLPFLLDPVNHLIRSRDAGGGRQRLFYSIPWGERTIWGVTAGILRVFYEQAFG